MLCFASRALTEVEQRYAVIEKEALAATWACDKFAGYVLGMTFYARNRPQTAGPTLELY